jgi:hypothetical protein
MASIFCGCKDTIELFLFPKAHCYSCNRNQWSLQHSFFILLSSLSSRSGIGVKDAIGADKERQSLSLTVSADMSKKQDTKRRTHRVVGFGAQKFRCTMRDKAFPSPWVRICQKSKKQKEERTVLWVLGRKNSGAQWETEPFPHRECGYAKEQKEERTVVWVFANENSGLQSVAYYYVLCVQLIVPLKIALHIFHFNCVHPLSHWGCFHITVWSIVSVHSICWEYNMWHGSLLSLD